MVWFTAPPRLRFDLGNDVSVTHLQAHTVAQVTWHGGLDLCDSRHQVIRDVISQQIVQLQVVISVHGGLHFINTTAH